MPEILSNPHRGVGLLPDVPRPSIGASHVEHLLAQCPAHRETPLIAHKALAETLGIAALWIKDERQRMGLGSFKALGAAYAIARAAHDTGASEISKALAGRCFVTASAGNHGLSVAAGARLFGARAVIFLARTVPEAFAERLANFGAEVVRAGDDYEASMVAAEAAAASNGWSLLSDSTWEGSMESGFLVMEGYLQMAAEAARQVPEPPTHILLQAGVGGLAGAVAAYARHVWADGPEIIVVEPAHAPALFESIKAGALVETQGPVSSMGRLDCKTASLVALSGLSHDADRFALITEDEAAEGIQTLAETGLATTPSGGAGLSALIAGRDLGAQARVLTILSEGPEDG